MIENSGQGISSDDLPMVFDRFYKADKSRSRDKNGMGLGLYLVKTILQLHGGNIQVSSVQGQYCRFEFWLPKPQQAPRLKENKESAPRVKESRARMKPGKSGKDGKPPAEEGKAVQDEKERSREDE